MISLTPRGLDVLRYAAAGHTYHSAAKDLGIAEQTVKNTLRAVRKRLGVASTIHAVALMDDHRPGWRPRLPIPARLSAIPARSLGFSRPETGPRRAGA